MPPLSDVAADVVAIDYDFDIVDAADATFMMKMLIACFTYAMPVS